MKITFFIGGLSGGGAERVVCQLASYLVEKNYEVKILTVSNSPCPYTLDERVYVSSLDQDNAKSNKVVRIYQKMKNLKKYIENNDTDVYFAFLTYSIASLVFFRKYIKVPVIASSRNDPSLYPPIMKLILKWAIGRVDGVVNQTNEIDEYFKQHIKMKSSVVIPNAISTEFMPYYGARDMRIVTAGRFNKQKNMPLLINAFSKIVKEYPDYSLVVYGDGALKEKYKTLVNSLNINDKVHFPGYVSKVSEQMKNAAMFVLPSDYEGISNALIEAMATGIPCIATDSLGGGSRMLIRDHENGLLIPRNDTERMYNAMKEYIEHPELAMLCGRQASNIPKDFSTQKIYSMWEKYMISICK